MTISTGVQAMAECAYGRTDEAMVYEQIVEQQQAYLVPSQMMPDYGCPVQAWTIYGLATPLLTYVLGINPDACNDNFVSPHFPGRWNKAAVYDLLLVASLSFQVSKHGRTTTYSYVCLPVIGHAF